MDSELSPSRIGSAGGGLGEINCRCAVPQDEQFFRPRANGGAIDGDAAAVCSAVVPKRKRVGLIDGGGQVLKQKGIWCSNATSANTASIGEKLPAVGTCDDPFAATAWSPDGRGLAGVVKDAGVFVYDLRTRTYRHPAGEGDFPKWLSDSQRLVYLTADRLALVDTARGEPKILLSVLPDIISSFSIAPHDRAIYYDRTTAQSDIWIADWR